MNSLIFCLLAACAASMSSLFFRKNADGMTKSFTPSAYLVIFYFSSFILSFLLDSDIWITEINLVILSIGACVGLLSSTLMLLTSKALQQGPAGLTFAFQNASAIFPGLILFLLFGSEFGFTCTYLQMAGMGIVLFGLFIGTKGQAVQHLPTSSSWLKYALGCFIVQIVALTLIQGRCLLFDGSQGGGIFSTLNFVEADDVWFMPGQFGASFVMQAIIFFRKNKKFNRNEVFYGTMGGVANFLSTLLLLIATKYALPFEKSILFPCFAVATMILCNLWANKIYKEKFNIKTNFICSFGIFMAAAS